MAFKMRLPHIRRGIALLLTSLITISLVVIASTQIGAVTPSETRGVWITNVDSDVLFSRQGTEKALERLAKLNFNTIYPTVWQGGYTLYPSAVAKRVFGKSVDPTPGLQERDVLKEVIAQGHKKGLKVIPWFEFGFMAPANSELAKQHPDWLTNRRDGTTVKMEGIHERVWLNPFHPAVQEFILDLITEIVANYNLDGIQFDDHFGLPAEFGYDNLTVGIYKKQINLSPSDDFQETFWVRWRADQINKFMEQVFHAIKAIKPNCIVSLSPNPLHFSLPAYLQDWFTWERRGWVEEIVLQVYRSEITRFTTELERVEVELAKSHVPVVIGIFTGVKNRSTPISKIEPQVKEVRQRGFAGTSFFFYESLWKWAEEPPVVRDRAIQRMFPTPVPRPSVFTTQ